MLSLNVLEASEDRFVFAVSILTLNDLILFFSQHGCICSMESF